MEAEKEKYPIKLLCRVLEISESRYYAWRKNESENRRCARVREDEALRKRVKEIFDDHQGRYGLPRIRWTLRMEGIHVGPHRLRRLMNELGIQGKTRRKRTRTTFGCTLNAASPNLLERRFEADKPGELWLSDLTYLPTDQGFLYLCILLDMATRQIVGWSMSESMHARIVVDALTMACERCPPKDGAILHSDRGVQYTSSEVRQQLEQLGMQQSMSRKGDCWDNAPAESFFATLKREGIPSSRLATRDDARAVVFQYIEGYYHSRRAHSALDYRTPNQVAACFETQQVA